MCAAGLDDISLRFAKKVGKTCNRLLIGERLVIRKGIKCP
jgi:hypothetical protein